MNKEMKTFLALTISLLALSALFLPGLLAVSSPEEKDDEAAAQREMFADEDMASREAEGYIRGKVVVADDDAMTLVIAQTQGDKDLYTFSVKKITSFTGADSLGDLGRGDRVKVDYYSAMEGLVADSVLVESRAPGEETASAPTLEKVLVD